VDTCCIDKFASDELSTLEQHKRSSKLK
jgi:hypothetical protein